ncbi:MAG: ABC-F family ATP-binding cassette domain-containing protein [Verrucomicrobiales bacterium]|nr:ABC-F family ATP-binding cassette domain-containing protein [Verrucomicrobiales bacterium]
MLTIRKLKKSYGGQTLFEDADLQINYGERVALVGPNGAGKSTIFRIILEEEEADRGEVERDEWTFVGFLPQESEAVGDESVLEIATGRAGQLEELEKILKSHEDAGTIDDPKYSQTQSKFDALNDPTVEAKAKKMLRGLGYAEKDFDRPAKEMSGGWVMRAHLARLLVMEPDLLMLDEPTNHLDLVSLLWFRDYLKNYSGAVLLISHDRGFMDELVETVYEISEKKLKSYTGNYSEYEEQRQKNYEVANASYKNQQKQIKELQDFANKFRSVSSKASQAQSKLKEIERMDKVEKPQAPKKPFRFQIPDPPRGGQKAVTLEQIDFAYETGPNIYENLDFTIERGERTVLVGPNGAGKSTLLKILANELQIQKGTRKEGHNAKIGYFSQHRQATLDPNATVVSEVMNAAPTLREDEARGILGSFMFRKEEVYKMTKVLSGGEKSRLSLVKFLVDPPNILLMDEPTTHLDILTVESLILALQRYQGTLVFISHDIHFIKQLATDVVYVAFGKLKRFSGDWEYFIEKAGGGDERAALTATLD